MSINVLPGRRQAPAADDVGRPNVTRNPTIPTGRYIDLVVTMADDGNITVYVDGQVAGTAKVAGWQARAFG